MFTQVELVSVYRLLPLGTPQTATDDEVAVYWLDYNPHERKLPLAAGQRIRIAESNRHWKISRVFTTLRRVEDLPTKACIGTLVAFETT